MDFFKKIGKEVSVFGLVFVVFIALFAYRQVTHVELSTISQDKLEEKIKPNQSNLSTGQKQRIALIRAILSEPDILILDESLSNIDIENRINIVKNLDECDFMKIYISHDNLGIAGTNDYYIINREIVQGVK